VPVVENLNGETDDRRVRELEQTVRRLERELEIANSELSLAQAPRVPTTKLSTFANLMTLLAIVVGLMKITSFLDSAVTRSLPYGSEWVGWVSWIISWMIWLPTFYWFMILVNKAEGKWTKGG
jgi:hypothetical protein